MSPVAWAALVTAGAVGASARHLLDRAVAGRARGEFPWGTFAVNVTGSLLLGLLTGLALYRGFPHAPQAVIGAGFCGAFTTFSTHAYETVRLVEDGALGRAARNGAGTLVASLVAAAAGLALAAV